MKFADVIDLRDLNENELAYIEGLSLKTVRRWQTQCTGPEYCSRRAQCGLHRACEVALGTYLHQDMPFYRLVEELGAQRYPGRSPLFQVQLILQSLPVLPQRSESLSASPLPFKARNSKLDLLSSVRDTAQDLSVLLEYDSDLFEASTVRRLARSFEAILGFAAENPDLPLSQIETPPSGGERALWYGLPRKSVQIFSRHCGRDLCGFRTAPQRRSH